MAVPARSTRPDAEHFPLCGLPAVEAWTVYDYAEGKPRWVEALPYCRFHEQTQHAAARQAAAKIGPKAHLYPANYTAGQSRVACAGDRNPVQLAAALDAERITEAADAARAALRQLTHLTTTVYGSSFEIGNEGAVLDALLELVDDVQEEAGVVARRLAARAGGWPRVAEATGAARPGDSDTARTAAAVNLWKRWGGGPGDEIPPVTGAQA